MKELQKYNRKLEIEWKELYHLMKDNNKSEVWQTKKTALLNLLSQIEDKLKNLNEITKELAQQLNHITTNTSSTRLSEHEHFVQKLASVQALLGDINNI